MIHYHGSPVSGPRQESARFYRGRHIMVSFAVCEHIDIVADVCSTFVIDNGAFSAWKRGCTVNWEEYFSFVGKWCRHPAFDWAVIPDVIDGSEQENDALVESWPSELPGVPVWHMHESMERLLSLADKFRVVALGSSGQWPTPGTESWWTRMAEAMAVSTEDGRPKAKLHGLRMLSPEIFQRLPLSSADSVNAAMNSGAVARFGMYCPREAWYRANVIADRIESYQSAATWCGLEETKMVLFE